MIESISSIDNNLSGLINNFVKKSVSKESKEVDIEDTYEGTKETEKFSNYNKNGVVAKNHTVLPDRYNSVCLEGRIYYKGENMTELEFLERAVENEGFQLDETKSVYENYSNAWKALVEDKAKPLYSWSKALYSEDGMYKFRVENGEITGMILARNADGVLYSDIAKELANGVKPCDMKTGILDLAHADPELYKVACEIGAAKRMYNDAVENSLFNTLFGFNVSENIDNFATLALENFNQNRYTQWFSKL